MNGDAIMLVTYTPNVSFTGLDTFTYQICSPTDPDVCASTTVLIDVVAPLAPPAVGDAAVATTENTPVSGAVVTTAPDDPSVTHTLGAPPVNGTAVVNADGTFTYTPAPGFTGTDTFTIIGCGTVTTLCDTGTRHRHRDPVGDADASRDDTSAPVSHTVTVSSPSPSAPPSVVTPSHSAPVPALARTGSGGGPLWLLVLGSALVIAGLAAAAYRVRTKPG